MARRILGLDLGSHSVKAVELRQSFRELDVVQMRALPLPADGVLPPDELHEFLVQHALPLDGVVVALPGHRLSSRRLSFPFRDRRRLAPAVPFELEGLVPFDMDEFVLDWAVAEEGDAGATVLAGLAPRTEVEALLERLKEAQIDPRTVEAGGPVLANLSSLFALPETCLLADLGHSKTTMSLLVGNRVVATRTAAFGGGDLTRALASEMGASEAETERAKHEEGVFDAAGGIRSPGATDFLDRLTRALARFLGAVTGFAPDDPSKLILFGGGAHLHRLDAYLGARLGLPTERLQAPAIGVGAAALAAGDTELFAPALALALRGSMRACTQMNFRQDDLAHRVNFRRVGREFRTPLALTTVALALTCGGILTEIATENRRGDALEAEAQARYEAAFPGEKPPRNVVSAMQQAVSDAQDRADTLGVYRGNLSALDILTEISARVPRDVDVVFEELAIDRQIVQIKGHTPAFGSVDRLRAELAKYAPFSAITVGDITRDARRGGQTFSMRISLSADGETS
jgi:type IV pilus assembly protein PilM